MTHGPPLTASILLLIMIRVGFAEKHRFVFAVTFRLPVSFEARSIRLPTYGDMWMPVGDSKETVGSPICRRMAAEEKRIHLRRAKPGWERRTADICVRTMTWIAHPYQFSDGETAGKKTRRFGCHQMHGITRCRTGRAKAANRCTLFFFNLPPLTPKPRPISLAAAYVGIGQDGNGTELGAILNWRSIQWPPVRHQDEGKSSSRGRRSIDDDGIRRLAR